TVSGHRRRRSIKGKATKAERSESARRSPCDSDGYCILHRRFMPLCERLEIITTFSLGEIEQQLKSDFDLLVAAAAKAPDELADGPVGPDQFRLSPYLFKKLTKRDMQILTLLWSEGSLANVEIGAAVQAIYDSPYEEDAFESARKRLGRKLVKQSNG